MANYEFGLKDFVITKDLLNITSPSFIKISGEFCSEVYKIQNMISSDLFISLSLSLSLSLYLSIYLSISIYLSYSLYIYI